MKNELVKAMLIRSIRTGAQTLLSFMTIGQAIMDINWIDAISITCTAMVISILTSIVTGLPEAGNKTGAFVLDNTDPDVTRWILQYDGDPDSLKPGDKVTFEVKGEE